ncbi:hypothetical protein CTER_5192 [Ruminiclostridium cellobioparum subsp. termitidis CT1112]|uniref:Uncharacterized protein n=1 Tax=Ruminiclostridium cellobioparum subsp. termitidis CT1112 TaxID=1195236 RepID=S0FJC6_RUMCE|nr:hypothetical protein CTER_5192 [Ruminiclostridium cellobioparum subsp. termitidis CT1112]
MADAVSRGTHGLPLTLIPTLFCSHHKEKFNYVGGSYVNKTAGVGL